MLLCSTITVGAQEPRPASETKQKEVARVESRTEALVVLVNAKNPITNLTLADLRAYFKLERTFWPNGKRSKLFLRRSSSEEMKLLRKHVYGMSAKELRRYFKEKSFRGEITRARAISVAPSADNAIAQVRKDEAAITVVFSSDLPEKLDGVRALAIDDKRPNQTGYKLAADEESEARAPSQ